MTVACHATRIPTTARNETRLRATRGVAKCSTTRKEARGPFLEVVEELRERLLHWRDETILHLVEIVGLGVPGEATAELVGGDVEGGLFHIREEAPEAISAEGIFDRRRRRVAFRLPIIGFPKESDTEVGDGEQPGGFGE